MKEAVNFIFTKFDEYEKERKEREQVIKNFEENVSVMNKKVENLEKELDKMSSILAETVSWFMG